MMESNLIEQKIKEAEKNLDDLKQQREIALRIEDQRDFLKTKKQLLNDVGVMYPAEKIGGMAGMVRLNDFFDLISLHLGYKVSQPDIVVGGFSISQLLVALDLIQNDERFQKYRGDLFPGDLVAG